MKGTRRMQMLVIGCLLAGVVTLVGGCGGGGGDGGGSIPATGGDYIVLAWNDLGMHCLNPSYDTAVILPPYNTVWAQVVKRDNPPQVVTSGLTVEYRMLNNTTSQNKGLFFQFWDYAQQLFGTTPQDDYGLNLDDPAVSNTLFGTMLNKGDHFQVSGVPVVPYDDGSTVRNPYQIMEVTVKDGTGQVIAQTRATVPTSEEINCAKCHGGSFSDPTTTFNNILAAHDSGEGTTLGQNKPILCASCHGSPALGTSGAGSSGKYLSDAIHAFHVNKGASCYDCHPGETTSCNRSAAHTAADGNCTDCHGPMSQVASSISSGGRIPWANEPMCVDCHTGVPEVDTGSSLYRNAMGHGGVYCTGCHGSPHAMVPSTQVSDNYQALQYQNRALSMGSCRNCHSSSNGGGSNFVGEHVNEGKTSACNVCHTGFINASNNTLWPHDRQWKLRTN